MVHRKTSKKKAPMIRVKRKQVRMSLKLCKTYWSSPRKVKRHLLSSPVKQKATYLTQITLETAILTHVCNYKLPFVSQLNVSFTWGSPNYSFVSLKSGQFEYSIYNHKFIKVVWSKEMGVSSYYRQGLLLHLEKKFFTTFNSSSKKFSIEYTNENNVISSCFVQHNSKRYCNCYQTGYILP